MIKKFTFLKTSYFKFQKVVLLEAREILEETKFREIIFFHSNDFSQKVLAQVLVSQLSSLNRGNSCSSVTRWIDYLFNLWLFTSMKICPIV